MLNSKNRQRGREGKRGISPVIATVLLIAIVVVIALIVFLWFRQTLREPIEKFGENVELVCEEVSFSASYDSILKKFSIVNDGSVPIEGMKVKKISNGDFTKEDLVNFNGLSLGGAGTYDFDATGYDRIILIPVLLGNSESGETSFVCDERHGVEVFI